MDKLIGFALLGLTLFALTMHFNFGDTNNSQSTTNVAAVPNNVVDTVYEPARRGDVEAEELIGISLKPTGDIVSPPASDKVDGLVGISDSDFDDAEELKPRR